MIVYILCLTVCLNRVHENQHTTFQIGDSDVASSAAAAATFSSAVNWVTLRRTRQQGSEV